MLDDAGFNALVTQGVRNFEAQRQVTVRPIQDPLGQMLAEPKLEAAIEQAIADGVDAVITLGSTYHGAIERLAQRHPQVRLVVIDAAQASTGNVQTVQFRSHEAAYLAGMVAARSTKSGTIGFVGGLDSPIIRAFGCAYAEGALATRADTRVLGRMIGTEATAYSDPAGGRRMARELLDLDADVVFAAAGGSGLGVMQEVADAGAFGIGVDDNQNGLHPGRILTSVLKRLDVSVYTTLVALQDGNWQPGMQSVGLTEGAVGLAMDEFNRNLVSRQTRAELETAEFAIRSEELQVIDAQVDDSRCTDLIEYEP
jgi:basic membrane protein A